MDKDTALRLALEALEYEAQKGNDNAYQSEREAIKAALEAKDEPWEKFCDSNCVWTDHHPDCKLAKDEPVAWMSEEDDCIFLDKDKPNPMDYDFWTPLYITPPQRKPLTEKELNVLGTQWHFNLLETKDKTELFAFARAIEAAHGIKGEA